MYNFKFLTVLLFFVICSIITNTNDLQKPDGSDKFVSSFLQFISVIGLIIVSIKLLISSIISKNYNFVYLTIALIIASGLLISNILEGGSFNPDKKIIKEVMLSFNQLIYFTIMLLISITLVVFSFKKN